MAWWEYDSHLFGNEEYDDAYDGWMVGSTLKVCRYCGAQGLRWRQHNGKWRLFDDGNLHVCQRYKTTVEPKNPDTIGLSGPAPVAPANEAIPCCFCGSVSVKVFEVETEPDVGWQATILAVHCNDCGARGPVIKGNRAKAIEAWNGRKT